MPVTEYVFGDIRIDRLMLAGSSVHCSDEGSFYPIRLSILFRDILSALVSRDDKLWPRDRIPSCRSLSDDERRSIMRHSQRRAVKMRVDLQLVVPWVNPLPVRARSHWSIATTDESNPDSISLHVQRHILDPVSTARLQRITNRSK